MEYKVDNVLTVLLSNDIIEEFHNSHDLFYCFLDYNVEGRAQIIADKILADSENTVNYINGLVRIYPLSERILKAVMDSRRVQLKLTEWFDVSETIQNMIMEIINSFAPNSFDKEKDDISYNLNELKKRKEQDETRLAELKSLREELSKSKKDNNAIHEEVERLQAEVDELKKEWSEDAINKKKEDLLKEKKELEKKQKNGEQTLKKLNEDIVKYQNNNDNSKFVKAAKALSEAVKQFPEDGSEQ